MIDWSKLEPYDQSKHRSFEELCYQIAKGLYENVGKFTAVDDSGGGDGVEFFLTLPNGDEWGWQAKFFFPSNRLNEGNRKQQIRKSLVRACDQHENLKRWFLCTNTRFTPNEQEWFDGTLRSAIPASMTVGLEHWSESDFNDWLSSSQFEGKRAYFFSELALTRDWFSKQVNNELRVVQSKFNPILHTSTDADSYIHAILGDSMFGLAMTERANALASEITDYNKRVNEFTGLGRSVTFQSGQSDFEAQCEQFRLVLEQAHAHISALCAHVIAGRFREVRETNRHEMQATLGAALATFEASVRSFDTSEATFSGSDTVPDDMQQRNIEEAKGLKWRILSAANDFCARHHSIVKMLGYLDRSEMRLLGSAGMGKTHLLGHIAKTRCDSGLPAIFILAQRFRTEEPIQEQLRQILGIPPAFGWREFLQALHAAAAAYNTRIPIIIDGINEATYHGAFNQSFWHTELPQLSAEISSFDNLVLITSCRTSYKEAIWPDDDEKFFLYVYGFSGDATREAMNKYFDYYKIVGDITALLSYQFSHPLYLHIFCESTNHARAEYIQVYAGQQTLFDVFDSYLTQCNTVACKRLGLHPRVDVLGQALHQIATYLWQQHSRSIPIGELAQIVDSKPLDQLVWNTSKTRMLLEQGILLDADWRDEGEVVFITYDLLAGYILAKYLVDTNTDIENFVNETSTIGALFSGNAQQMHPLGEDIKRCLAALIPIRRGKYLHDLSNEYRARVQSIESLFEIAPQYVDEASCEQVVHLFSYPENRKWLLDLTFATLGNAEHPLNMQFWHERLRDLSLPERDLSWSEFVRDKVEDFDTLIDQFTSVCRSENSQFISMQPRVRQLAMSVQWMLTSTMRAFRDGATRALYFFARRDPEYFRTLLKHSLLVNDPYVQERTLAAAYGLAMARHYEDETTGFVRIHLLPIARLLFDAMFASQAAHGTTHIRTRDYARRTIEVALLHAPDLLTSEERQRVTPPFTDNGIRDWSESDDKNDGQYRDGNSPIDFLDDNPFEHLGKGIDKYHDTPERRSAEAKLWWRIYGLGYDFDQFSDVDKWIARANQWQRENERHTDHYGRKYCLIATCELAGYREDQGLLMNDFETEPGRMFFADIDPSFPVEEQEHLVIDADFLGDRSSSLEEWIVRGSDPDYEPYLCVSDLPEVSDNWVLLDGYMTQEDTEAHRRMFAFPRAFIVSADEETAFADRLKRQNLEGRWLPESPEEHYLYAGEIPWCDTFPCNGTEEMQFVESSEEKTVMVERLTLTRDGEPISAEEEEEFWKSEHDAYVAGMLLVTYSNDDVGASFIETLRDRGLQLEPKAMPETITEHTYTTFNVLLPVRDDAWESYHSTVNPGLNIAVPCREIAERLNLQSKPQTFDLFDSEGRKASICLRHGDLWHTGQRLLYLRRDLLDKYLQETQQSLVWAVWGQREIYTRNWDAFETEFGHIAHHGDFQFVKEYAPQE